MGSRVQLKRLWDLKKYISLGFIKKVWGIQKKKKHPFSGHMAAIQVTGAS